MADTSTRNSAQLSPIREPSTFDAAFLARERLTKQLRSGPKLGFAGRLPIVADDIPEEFTDDDDDDDDSDAKEVSCASKVQEVLQKVAQRSTRVLAGPLDLVEGVDANALCDKLERDGVVSAFGNHLTNRTEVDTDVRDALELTGDALQPFVETIDIDRIAETIRQRMFPTGSHIVVLEPYKASLYGVGGHFAEHTDTPRRDVVATLVIELQAASVGGELQFAGVAAEPLAVEWVTPRKEMKAAAMFAVFFPDVPHRISKVEAGRRLSLQYHVKLASGKPRGYVREIECRKYSRIGGPQMSDKAVREELKAVLKDCRMLGIGLTERYPRYNVDKLDYLKGVDAVLLQVARDLSFDVDVCPVNIFVQASWYAEDEYFEGVTYKASVTAFPKELLATAHYERLIQHGFFECKYDFVFPFHDLGEYSKMQTLGGHTGNYSNPAEIDNHYFTTALLLKPGKGA